MSSLWVMGRMCTGVSLGFERSLGFKESSAKGRLRP